MRDTIAQLARTRWHQKHEDCRGFPTLEGYQAFLLNELRIAEESLKDDHPVLGPKASPESVERVQLSLTDRVKDGLLKKRYATGTPSTPTAPISVLVRTIGGF